MSSDPFEILGIEPVFRLDEPGLHQRFVAAAAAVHPDRFSDPWEQAQAAERSAAVNQAYQRLIDPRERAEVLLARLGGPGKEADKSLPKDLLVEMMEAREEMEAAIETKNEETLARLREWANKQQKDYLTSIAGLFDQASKQSADERVSVLREVRLQINALGYTRRMIEQMPR